MKPDELKESADFNSLYSSSGIDAGIRPGGQGKSGTESWRRQHHDRLRSALAQAVVCGIAHTPSLTIDK